MTHTIGVEIAETHVHVQRLPHGKNHYDKVEYTPRLHEHDAVRRRRSRPHACHLASRLRMRIETHLPGS